MNCVDCGASLISPKGVSLIVCPFCQTDNSAKKQVAKSEGEAALREEFVKRGEALYQDKKILRALISDYFAKDKKLRNNLLLAEDEDIPKKILELLPDNISKQRIGLSLIMSYFTSCYEMDKSHVEKVIRIFTFVAGISDEVFEGVSQVSNDKSKYIDNSASVQSLQIGDNYPFGGYNWRILDKKDNKILLLSEDILERQAYHKDRVNITWEQCTLRQYLNGEFFNKFSQADKNRIVKERIVNPDNLWYGTKGGNDTVDNVFILNNEESDRYFGNSRDYLGKRGKFKRHGIYVGIISNNYDKDRVALYNGSALWWWLRSPGSRSNRAAAIFDDGNVHTNGIVVDSTGGGVRPALWLNTNQ